MLSLYDGSRGKIIEVATGSPGGFRVLVGATPDGARSRALLVADLIRRVADWRGRRALVFCLTGGDAEGADLAAGLNVHPPDHEVAAADIAGQRFDICVGQAPDGAVAGHALTVARIERAPSPRGVDPQRAPSPRGVDPPGSPRARGAFPAPRSPLGGDGLAVRLVLLGMGYRQAVTVDDQATTTAEQLLDRWRKRVATWAQSPSGAPAAGYLDAVVAAFENDLDAPAALRELAALEADETVKDGAKFETFAAADRLLGLDVASQIG